MFDIGDIVTHENPYHRRGASRGAIEAITEQGWYQVYWEEDEENQILPALRTYSAEEIKLCPSSNLEKASTRPLYDT